MGEIVVTKDIIADPKSRYGHGKAATRHFIVQRLTGAINVVFVLLLVFVALRVAGADAAGTVAMLSDAWLGLPLAVLVLVACVHMRIGMREIIEDYVHDPRLNNMALTLNSFVCLAAGLVAAGALVKLVFWG